MIERPDWHTARVDEEILMRAYEANGAPVHFATSPAAARVLVLGPDVLFSRPDATMDVGAWSWQEDMEMYENARWPKPAPMVDLNKLRARRARYAPDNAPCLSPKDPTS